MEHILDIYINNLPPNMRGFVFGFVHVGIMLIGYYSGLSINRFLKIVSKGYIAGITARPDLLDEMILALKNIKGVNEIVNYVIIKE